jgi:hypothetical protein
VEDQAALDELRPERDQIIRAVFWEHPSAQEQLHRDDRDQDARDQAGGGGRFKCPELQKPL